MIKLAAFLITLCFAGLYVSIFFFTDLNFNSIFMSVLYKLANILVVIFMYCCIFYIAFEILKISASYLNKELSSTVYEITKDGLIKYCIILICVSLLYIYGNINYYDTKRVEIPLHTEKHIGNRDRLKIVAMADLHLGYSIGMDELRQWVNLVNSESPDIILISGDIVDTGLRPLIEENAAEVLRMLNAPLGIYAVLGNHERHWFHGIESFMQDAGITLLNDSWVEINDSFYVVGRDDMTSEHRGDLSSIMRGIDPSKLVILLDHQPRAIDESIAAKVDIQISGHTHRGQIWPVNIITDIVFDVPYGHVKKENTDIIVTSGIGVWGAKLRIGTNSEYLVLDLTNSNND